MQTDGCPPQKIWGQSGGSDAGQILAAQQMKLSLNYRGAVKES